jgi:outer membrane protein insertion porin family/translocation and assembly module TamA
MNDFTRYSVADFALQDPSYVGQLIALGLDPVSGAGAGTLVALRLQALHSTVADLARAPRGYSVSVAAERAGGLLTGDFTYTEYTGEGRHYQPMPRGVVVANRIRLGLIDDGAPTEAEAAGRVPFFKRYFLGGSTSLRGWGRFDVSPLTESGLPIGGLALLETSSELRVPVSDDLSLVGFVDTGNVWRRPGDLDTSGLRVSVGPGIRYLTPVGPVRLDVGYQLTPIDGLVVRGRPETRRWRVHVSIGQAF